EEGALKGATGAETEGPRKARAGKARTVKDRAVKDRAVKDRAVNDPASENTSRKNPKPQKPGFPVEVKKVGDKVAVPARERNRSGSEGTKNSASRKPRA